MKPIIEVQNLSKKYQINAQQQGYLSFRDTLSNAFSFSKNKEKEDFWALQDINFTVEAGESVGIIGRNGAGKSTLLKILSRITPPTKGQIILRGRVASLLEVGTGFHPELTGRENVYFNGSILGLRKSEIDKKFDEIVDFSGVEQFIDTPLKQYSSGMKLRLAFSVAAHLEPEILIIDEVLAVGDAEFQKKCLGKMDDVAKSGRTVLFVSHNMGAVQSLCSNGIFIESGQMIYQGEIKKTMQQYLKNNERYKYSEWKNNEPPILNNDYFTPLYFAIVDNKLNPLNQAIDNQTQVGVLIESKIDTIHPLLSFGFGIYTNMNEPVFRSYQTDHVPNIELSIKKGRNRWIAWLPLGLLNEGDYNIELVGCIHNQFWIFEPRKSKIEISFRIKHNITKSPYWSSSRPGMLAPSIKFNSIN